MTVRRQTLVILSPTVFFAKKASIRPGSDGGPAAHVPRAAGQLRHGQTGEVEGGSFCWGKAGPPSTAYGWVILWARCCEGYVKIKGWVLFKQNGWLLYWLWPNSETHSDLKPIHHEDLGPVPLSNIRQGWGCCRIQRKSATIKTRVDEG